MPYAHPNDRRTEAINAYAGGLTLREAAIAARVSHESVRKWVLDANIPLRPHGGHNSQPGATPMSTIEAKPGNGSAPLYSAADPRQSAASRTRLGNLLRTNGTVTLTITPVMAEIMLERNTGNRRLSRHLVAQYAADMNNGAWDLTGEPIIFAASGELQDGQHRLRAAVQSGVSFRSDVRFGVDRQAFLKTGVGKPRSVANALEISQEKNANGLAAGLRWLHLYQYSLVTNPTKFMPSDAAALLQEHPDMRKAATVASTVNQSFRPMPLSIALVCYYLFSRIDQAQADEFFDRVKTGVGITDRSDPEAALRNRLVNEAAMKHRVRSEEIFAVTIKAWNARREGRKIGRGLHFVSRGERPETFPVAV